MTGVGTSPDPFLTGLGWSAFYDAQVRGPDCALAPMRVATVHRSKLTAIGQEGPISLSLDPHTRTTDFAVGDWVLVDPQRALLVRRLDRQSLLQRRAEDVRHRQLIAANVDTLFIVTSCNADFNLARLERYLALANEAGTTPVIVLTKADQADDAATYLKAAAGLQRDLQVVAINAKAPQAAAALAPWCRAGQTTALVGSSGVGKSTLLNTLTDAPDKAAQATGTIRHSDAKGRHTTTARSLHAMAGGGWIIDTPGMRTLNVSDVAAGLDVLFAEITELAPNCHFRDCTHAHEPGCAVQAALGAGTIDPDRLARWRKLTHENQTRAASQAGTQGKKPATRRRKRR